MVKSCWISIAHLTVDMESPAPQEYLVLSADAETTHKFTAMRSTFPKDSEKAGSCRILWVYPPHGGKLVDRFRICASYQVFRRCWALHIHCQMSYRNPTAFDHLFDHCWHSTFDFAGKQRSWSPLRFWWETTRSEYGAYPVRWDKDCSFCRLSIHCFTDDEVQRSHFCVDDFCECTPSNDRRDPSGNRAMAWTLETIRGILICTALDICSLSLSISQFVSQSLSMIFDTNCFQWISYCISWPLSQSIPSTELTPKWTSTTLSPTATVQT